LSDDGMTQAIQNGPPTTPKRLLLMRHARIEARLVGRLIGSTDAALDPMGETQARLVADRILQWSPELCCCSPMRRCRRTASIVASQLPLDVDPDLREIDFGHFETKTFSEAAVDDPTLADRWAAFGGDFAFPGGESVGDFLRRVCSATERLIHSPARTILAVTHGGVIRAMICLLLGLDPRRYLAFDVPYAGLAVIDVFDKGNGVLLALERPEPTEAGHG
jgi:alpha-ribazole phosphatase